MLTFRATIPYLVLILIAAGCRAPEDSGASRDDDIRASLESAAPTVVRVSWTTEEPNRGQVRFGESEAYGWETPLESVDTSEHSALLLGLPHNTEIHFAIVTSGEQDEIISSDHSIVTGGVPSTLPSLTVELGERSPAPFTVVSVVADTGDDDGQVVAVVDALGRWVWAVELDPGYQALRARLARDGSGVIYNALAADKEDDLTPKIVHVAWTGERLLELDAPDLHHDFVELPEGGFAYLATEPRQVGDLHVGSDLIVELDTQGDTREAWVLWDHLESDFGVLVDAQSVDPSGNIGHANALQLLEGGDAWLVSFASLGAVARIDRASGTVTWVLGGNGDSFGASPEPVPDFRSHEVVLDGDNLWMFVNNAGGEDCSRLWTMSLDIERASAAVTGEYHWEPCQYSYAMGGVNRIGDTYTQIVWSLAGKLEVVDETLEPVWAAQASLGAGFGYGAVTTSLYTPD